MGQFVLIHEETVEVDSIGGSIILAADGSLSLRVKSCGSDHVITEAQTVQLVSACLPISRLVLVGSGAE